MYVYVIYIYLCVYIYTHELVCPNIGNQTQTCHQRMGTWWSFPGIGGRLDGPGTSVSMHVFQQPGLSHNEGYPLVTNIAMENQHVE